MSLNCHLNDVQENMFHVVHFLVLRVPVHVLKNFIKDQIKSDYNKVHLMINLKNSLKPLSNYIPKKITYIINKYMLVHFLVILTNWNRTCVLTCTWVEWPSTIKSYVSILNRDPMVSGQVLFISITCQANLSCDTFANGNEEDIFFS